MIRILLSISLVIVGLSIRIISIKTLRGDFSFQLKSPSNITTSGIYKYIRHPSYLGSLLMILGLSLITPVLGIMAIAYAFFLSRITNEEQILMRDFKYLDYRKRTGMFIPKLRRHNG